MPSITVETLSGQSVAVDLSSSATLRDLWGAIGVQLGVPHKHLQLAVGASLLTLDESMNLETAGVEDGTRVSAIVRQRPPLPVLPSTFEVQMSSSRIRLGFHRNSSAFTMLYKLKVDVPKSCIYASVVRKNDTDHFEFDGQKGCWKGDHGHWMAGTTQIAEQPHACFELGDLLQQWMDDAEAVFEPEKQLWTMPSEEANEKNEGGWFVAPSEDCCELYINAPFPISGPTSDLRIARVLVDQSGTPVRAALYHPNDKEIKTPRDHLKKADTEDLARAGNCALEEYDVSMTF